MLEGPVGTQVDEQRVDLDQFAGLFGFASLGQALGVALALGQAAAGPAAQDRHGDDRAAGDEPAEDAPDGGDGRGQAVPVEELGDLSLAPHRVVGAQGLNRFDESRRPFRLARALGSLPAATAARQMAEMNPLRRWMIEDMTIRNLSPATQRSYLYAVSRFSRRIGWDWRTCAPTMNPLPDSN